MLCYSKNIDNAIPFTNFDFVDTYPAFKKAREEIEFLIPEFIKYISGDRVKSKVYGNIKKYFPEELVFMNNNILENNVDNIKNIDTIIEDSCSIYKNLRVVILKEDINLTNIIGYDIVSYTNKDVFTNTIFIQDMKVDTRLAFNMCIKLFDNIIVNNLYKNNIPVHCSKYIPVLFNGDNGFKVSKFIIDYYYELLYPFATKIATEKKEVEEIAYRINKYNFEIISEDQLINLYKFISDKENGIVDDFDYLGLIMDYEKDLSIKDFINDGNIDI